MLTLLRIHNFAIIDALELSLEPRLVVFTGETGAGKSIILDALDVLLGGKTEPTMIRTGAERATIEGEFVLNGRNKDPIQTLLSQEELLEEDGSLVISREIRKEGRTTTRVNGRAAGAQVLKSLAELLVDIHGQTEHLSIFNVKTHVELLDRFADLSAIKADYQSLFAEYSKTNRELARIRQIQANASQRQDMLRYQIDEIKKAAFKPGEDEQLKTERDRLANAEALSLAVQQSTQLLDEGSYENPSITDQLGNLTTTMHTLARLDPSQQDLLDRAETAFETLGELAHDLRLYGEAIEFNPNRLEALDNRLDLLNQLSRKYGGSIESITEYEQKAVAELDTITYGDEQIQLLEEQKEHQLNRLTDLGQNLTKQRIAAAKLLGSRVEQELDDLKMASAKFQVEIQPLSDEEAGPNQPAFDKNGFDRVEFMIAPNLGEGFKPLVKIASGGETSRLMLALKNTLATEDNIPTLVFDEIDQGIGGRVGNVVGEKLFNLGLSHQVFCVTHLPQLAAFGNQHYKVEKVQKDGRTTTIVRQLAQDERLTEIASMFGELSEGTITSARELLVAANAGNQ